jgi:serine protease Do
MPAWPLRAYSVWFCLGWALCSSGRLHAEDLSSLPRAFGKLIPENVQDLKEIQHHVQGVLTKVMPLTVGLRIGPSQGSGVLITKEGYILTAAHVSGKPDQAVEIILHDGRKVKGKTLGANQAIDSGLIKITDPGYWFHAEMAQTSELRRGQWVIALGHPLGYHEGRPPVARLGRLLEVEKLYLRTDCPLVGGDSGGPLFDMHGRVVGIHSRIGSLLSANIHVPVDTYHETWDRLARGEIWGTNLFDHGTDAYLGLRLDPAARITLVAPNSPAEKAGVRINDVMILFEGKKVSGSSDLETLLRDKQPGTEVTLQLRRGEALLNLKLVLAKRP